MKTRINAIGINVIADGVVAHREGLVATKHRAINNLTYNFKVISMDENSFLALHTYNDKRAKFHDSCLLMTEMSR